MDLGGHPSGRTLDREDLGLDARRGISGDIDSQENLAPLTRREQAGIDLELDRRDLPRRGHGPGNDCEGTAHSCAQELAFFQHLERESRTAFLPRLLVRCIH